MALCGADRSTFHTAHQPPSPSWQLLDQEKEWFGINSAGAFPCPTQWKQQGHDGQGLVAAAGAGQASATATAWPARHVTSFRGRLLASFQASEIADGNSDPEVVADTNRSAGFPLWVWVHLYFSVSCACFHLGPNIVYRHTDTEGRILQSQVGSKNKLLSKSRWVLGDLHHHHHHLSSILCLLLRGLAIAITISPATLSYCSRTKGWNSFSL